METDNVLRGVHVSKDNVSIVVVDVCCGNDVRIGNDFIPEGLVVAEDHPGSAS